MTIKLLIFPLFNLIIVTLELDLPEEFFNRFFVRAKGL
jgi:hypothetical protein